MVEIYFKKLYPAIIVIVAGVLILMCKFMISAKSVIGEDYARKRNSKSVDAVSENLNENETYIHVYHHEDGSVALSLDVENDIILAIGDEMNNIIEDAYMNGINWEAFMNYYLAENAPDILDDMNTDSEAGTYVVYYEDGKKNENKVKRLANIIVNLINNKEEIFKILRDKGDEVEWE